MVAAALRQAFLQLDRAQESAMLSALARGKASAHRRFEAAP